LKVKIGIFNRQMALITFLSDFGLKDHYSAAVKATILGINPNLRIIDISHTIEPCNLAQASFTLSAVFRDFPEGTVHLVAVNSSNGPNDNFLGLKIEGHYFLGNDNGFWGLISDQEAAQVVDINSITPLQSSFPAKDIMAPAAAKLASGSSLQDLGKGVESYRRMLGRSSRATKKQISGHVIHVDHYGNLVTSIKQEDFDILSKDRHFTVKFGRETMNKIQGSYNGVENGDAFLLFNSSGLLEIGINNGNAKQLLGLGFDSPVTIQFEE